MSQPISRNGFFYNGSIFYVDVEGNQHTREDSKILHSILAFDAGKKNPQPLPPKDRPAHFYTAQLQHYGLKLIKSKPAAKKALLGAFDGKKLAVPANILALEKNLQEAWKTMHASTDSSTKKRKAEASVGNSAQSGPSQKKSKSSATKQSEPAGGSSGAELMKDGIRAELVKKIVKLQKAQLHEYLTDVFAKNPKIVDVFLNAPVPPPPPPKPRAPKNVRVL